MRSKLFLVWVFFFCSCIAWPLSAQQSYKFDVHYLEYDSNKVRLDIYNPGIANSPVAILIHGAAGIEGDRAERYRGFARDLRNRGIIAINVYYFQSERKSWVKTFQKTIDYAVTIPNADSARIGLIGYSLGGTVALSVASVDNRVGQLAIESGYLPAGFTRQDAARLPATYICSGTEDSAIKTLNQLKSWFREMGKPIETKVNQGYGHTVPMSIFRQNWLDLLDYLEQSFGLRAPNEQDTIRIRM